MSWLKLGIPITVGALAAFLNWQLLTAKAPTRTFVRVKEPVRTGAVLTDDNLAQVELSGSEETVTHLGLTAVPWRDRAVLKDRPVVRDLSANDLVLWSDVTSARAQPKEPFAPISLEELKFVPPLLQVEDQIYFVISPAPAAEPRPSGALEPKAPEPKAPEPRYETVGPFRVLAIGEMGARQGLASRESRGASERTIQVAVHLQNGKVQDENYFKVIAAQAEERRGASRIHGIVLAPRDTGSRK